MAAATEPQSVPVMLELDVSAHIVAMLDATLAAIDTVHPSFSILPNAQDYAVVDLAIRLWASVHPEVRIEEWGQWSREPSGDDPGWWIEGYKLEVGFRSLLTVHTPEGLRTRQPKAPVAPANDVAPLPAAPIDAVERAQPRDLDEAAQRFGLLELD